MENKKQYLWCETCKGYIGLWAALTRCSGHTWVKVEVKE